MDVEGRTFECIIASDVVRDGLGVELNELRDGIWVTVAEVFRSDVDGSVTFSALEPELPFAAVQILVEWARDRLVPRDEAV